MPAYNEDNFHKRPFGNKKRTDLISENTQLKSINVDNCIGAVKSYFNLKKLNDKLQKNLDDALGIVNHFEGQMQLTQELRMTAEAENALLRQEIVRLKLELNGRKLN